MANQNLCTDPDSKNLEERESDDKLTKDSIAMARESPEMLNPDDIANRLHNIEANPHSFPTNDCNANFPDQLSTDSSSPSCSAGDSEADHEKLDDLNPLNLDLNDQNSFETHEDGELGDRVMSRRSTQQAPTDDMFGRPLSSWAQAGRLQSASTRALGGSTGFESLGVEDEDTSHKVQNMHGAFERLTPFSSNRPRSSRMDGSRHHPFSPQDLGLDSLQTSDEIKSLFQYIDAYKPQEVEIATILKPFIPDYILAVGATDEFIKVPRPDQQPDYLGLKVLDESGPRQSDPAVLTLQLRAASNQPGLHLLEVASIENAQKNPKKLDAWINSIKDLHRARPPPSVIYSKVMPEVDRLIQEWPTEIEKVLSEIQLPTAKLDVDLPSFVDICCSVLDIPVYKSRVESLHVMFSLYLELKNSHNQFYLPSEWTSSRP